MADDNAELRVDRAGAVSHHHEELAHIAERVVGLVFVVGPFRGANVVGCHEVGLIDRGDRTRHFTDTHTLVEHVAVFPSGDEPFRIGRALEGESRTGIDEPRNLEPCFPSGGGNNRSRNSSAVILTTTPALPVASVVDLTIYLILVRVSTIVEPLVRTAPFVAVDATVATVTA